MMDRTSTKRQGLPAWITDELIAETLHVWQPSYDKQLTEDDAIEILLGVAALFDALGDADDERVSSASAGI